MTGPSPEASDVEQGLLELFRRELHNAVSDIGSSADDSLDSIRTHKLVLSGIRAFELEDRVTIQWYLDGDMLPKLPEDGVDVPIVTNAGVEDGPFPTPEEVYSFYTEELAESIPTGETLSEVLARDAFEWLNDYYDAREVPFSDVYRTNLEVYLRLRQFQNYLDPEGSREELPGNATPSSVVDAVSDASTRLKRALTDYPLFQNTPPYVTEFDRLATQILGRISEDVEAGAETEGYEVLVSHLGRFYYKAVWQPIADRIGFYTVSAPTKEKTDEARGYRTRNLRSARTTFLNELDRLRDDAREFGIRLETRVERLPKLRPEQNGLEDVLGVEMGVSGDA
jgi:hypothetical protein